MWRVILTLVQVFSSLAIIALVLFQRGKGAEAGAGFGAGASGTVFGARGASTALSRATAIFAAIFMINSLLLTYMATRTVTAAPKSILDTAAEKANSGKPAVIQTTPAPSGAGSAVTTAPAPAPASTAVPAPAAPPASAPAQPTSEAPASTPAAPPPK
jgi:preprotein translocase subunit SecG